MRTDDILWDAKLKVARYNKQNTGISAREKRGREIRVKSCIPLLTELCV